MKKLFAILALVLSMNFLGATLAFAATTEPESEYSNFNVFEVLDVTDSTSDNVDNGTDLVKNLQDEAAAKNTSVAGALILRAINILSLLVGTFAFLMIMYGGFMMVTAGGDQSMIDRSKNVLTQSIFGLILAFMAYFIVTFVQSFFY